MIKFKQYINEMIHGTTKLINDRGIDVVLDPAEHHESLSKHYTPKITDEKQKYAILAYTDDTTIPDQETHKKINKYLNTGIKPQNFEHSETINHLDKVTTSHEAPHDFHVYSGIKYDPSEGKDHKEPFKAHIKQFTSSSLRAGMASNFAHPDENQKYRHILKIHIPKGSKHGAYIHDHSTHTKTIDRMYSKYPISDQYMMKLHSYEHEFLMKRGLKLKIHHKPEIQSYSGLTYDKAQKYLKPFKIWHATIED